MAKAERARAAMRSKVEEKAKAKQDGHRRRRLRALTIVMRQKPTKPKQRIGAKDKPKENQTVRANSKDQKDDKKNGPEKEQQEAKQEKKAARTLRLYLNI